MIGNDVIDLRAANRVPWHPRFAARVLSARERGVLQARNADLTLLCRFLAAKEAAYKLFVRRLGRSVPLLHQRFEVQAGFERLVCPHGECGLHITVAPGQYVHAVAFVEPGKRHAAVHRLESCDPSQEVRRRLLAAAARELRVAEPELQVMRKPNRDRWDGFEPPHLERAGAPLAVNFSLSHDGDFVAYALAA